MQIVHEEFVNFEALQSLLDKIRPFLDFLLLIYFSKTKQGKTDWLHFVIAWIKNHSF